jgi:beta-glucosidase
MELSSSSRYWVSFFCLRFKYIELYFSRQKLWPRLWETYGEDVKLVKDMGRAYTESMQGDDLKSRQTVAACLKSFVGYGHPQSGRDRTPAWIDERQMHEYFLPPFEESVRAGAVSVMINPGDVNGIPGHANYHLMTEILKDKYQFQGFLLSDWVHTHHTEKFLITNF